MVRNTKGGNKTKGQARKTFTKGSSKLRKSNDPNEIYAIVTKLYGNGRILIKCNDGIERNCIIRNKFKGRNKRDNEIMMDTLILAGRREWEKKGLDKLETCDLLEVYSLQDRNELKRDSNIQWNILQSNDTKDDRDVDFINIELHEVEEEDEDEESDGHVEEVNLTHCFGEEVSINDI